MKNMQLFVLLLFLIIPFSSSTCNSNVSSWQNALNNSQSNEPQQSWQASIKNLIDTYGPTSYPKEYRALKYGSIALIMFLLPLSQQEKLLPEAKLLRLGSAMVFFSATKDSTLHGNNLILTTLYTQTQYIAAGIMVFFKYALHGF